MTEVGVKQMSIGCISKESIKNSNFSNAVKQRCINALDEGEKILKEVDDILSGKKTEKNYLLSFIERIERLEEEKKAIMEDIKEIYAEAKGAGFDVKTMRQIIRLRKMDAADREEHEFLINSYSHAVGLNMSFDFGLNAKTENIPHMGKVK